MTNRERGLKVFKSFWKWSNTFHGASFKYSFEEFLSLMEPKKAKLDIYIDGIGNAVKESGVSDSRIESAMKSLALASQGRIIENPLRVINYLQGQVGAIDWKDASLSVAGNTIWDMGKSVYDVTENTFNEGFYIARSLTDKVVEGTEVALDSTISILKNAKWIIPVLLIGSAALYVYIHAKAGKR